VAPVAHDILSDVPRFTPQQQQQQQQELRQALLLSPDASQAVCLLLVVTAYARMLQGQQEAAQTPGSSSSSSSSRSATARPATSYSMSSSGAPFHSTDTTSSSHKVTGSVDGLAAKVHVSNSGKREAVFRSSWDLACSRHHLLPAVHDELLKAMRCNSKAVVLLAAIAASPAAAGSYLGQADALTLMSDVYTQLVLQKEQLLFPEAAEQQEYWLSDSLNAALRAPVGSVALPGLADQLAQQPQLILQWSAAEQKLHLLLPSVLLLTAAETPSSSSFTTEDYVASCNSAGKLGWLGSYVWKLQEDLCVISMTRQHFIWRSLQGVPTDSVSDQQAQALQGHQPSQQLAQAVADLQLVAAQTEEAMHISVHYILPKLLSMCQSDSSSSSSSKEQSSSRSTIHTGHNNRYRSGPSEAFVEVLRYVCMLSNAAAAAIEYRVGVISGWCAAAGLCDTTSVAAVAASKATAVAAGAAVTAAWSQRSAGLCPLLESFLRMQAAMPDGGGLARESSILALHCSRRRSAPGTAWCNGGLLQAVLDAGPGSTQQAQLFSLLCSHLKFASTLCHRFIIVLFIGTFLWILETGILTDLLCRTNCQMPNRALTSDSCYVPVHFQS
jgi:hypothetical protein